MYSVYVYDYVFYYLYSTLVPYHLLSIISPEIKIRS